MEKLKINLTIEEVNKVLEALGNMPYARVYELVQNIQQQAQSQLKGVDIQQPATPAENGSSKK